MSLIQPLKFRTLKTGCFKMPRLQMPHLQTALSKRGLQLPLGSISAEVSDMGGSNLQIQTQDLAIKMPLILNGFLLMLPSLINFLGFFFKE